MAGVASRLLDQVDQDPAGGPGVDVLGEPGDAARDRGEVVEVCEGEERGVGCLGGPAVVREELLERAAARLERGDLLGRTVGGAGDLEDPGPVGLDRGGVVEQAGQAQGAGGGDEGGLLVGQAVGGPPQCLALIVQEGEQRLALVVAVGVPFLRHARQHSIDH